MTLVQKTLIPFPRRELFKTMCISVFILVKLANLKLIGNLLCYRDNEIFFCVCGDL